jgi:hypothetical protein
MITRLELRNKKIYIVITDSDWEKPRLIESFYLCHVDYSIFPENLNSVKPEKYVNAWIINLNYRMMSLESEIYPEFTEFITIPPPRKTGYKWDSGYWQKIKTR